jgi:hypothetical protein
MALNLRRQVPIRPGPIRALALAVLLLLAAAAPAAAALEFRQDGRIDLRLYAFSSLRAWDENAIGLAFGEFRLQASRTTETGIDYGGQIELRGRLGTNDAEAVRIARASLYLGGWWGRAELGEERGAAWRLGVGAPGVGTARLDRDLLKDDLKLAFRGRGATSRERLKLSYFSPRLFGFRAGVSYTPTRDRGDLFDWNDGTDPRHIVEMAAQWRGDVGPAEVTASLSHVRSGDQRPRAGREKFRAWSGGLEIAYAGFSLGGSWSYDGNADQPLGTNAGGWQAGAAYENGPYGVSLGGGQWREFGLHTDLAILGGSVQLRPGIAANLSFVGFREKPRTGRIANGAILMAETSWRF